MPDLETYLQDQTLSRSYSFELPSNNSHLSTMDLMSPSARYFPSEQRNQIEKNFRSSSINGLVNSAMIGSQVSLTNRKVSLIYLLRVFRNMDRMCTSAFQSVKTFT